MSPRATINGISPCTMIGRKWEMFKRHEFKMVLKYFLGRNNAPTTAKGYWEDGVKVGRDGEEREGRRRDGRWKGRKSQ